MSRRVVLVCLICLGCHVGGNSTPPADELGQDEDRSPADNMPRGNPSHPPFVREANGNSPNDLATAVISLEKGDDLAACFHLGRFLQKHPDHANARFYFAELLWKLGKAREARMHFEQAEADAQDRRPPDVNHQIHLHSRLLAVAEEEDDDYRMHLHRGIGFILLAQGRAKVQDPNGDLPVEGLLCKAAGELTLAHALKTGEARPCWYLFVAWHKLGQSHQARKWLALAQEAAPFARVTPAEQRGLYLAASAIFPEDFRAAHQRAFRE